jgi:chitodextrinase
MRYLFLFVLLLIGSVQLVFAQVDTETFTVRFFGGLDTTPPSTPTLLSVAPVSSSQIDLSWSSSTDDFGLSGYNVFRNGVSIATTSQLSYSDGGLTASTSFSYMVRAFDGAHNYSSTSNSIATKTLNVYVNSNPLDVQGTVARVVVKDFSVVTGISTTSIDLSTARPSRVEVRWGRSDAYELGYIVSNVYSRDHNVLLTDLEPGTTYEYEVVVHLVNGLEVVVKKDAFTTDIISEQVSPQNVARFLAFPDGDSVGLSWQLPPQDDISHVRIVRSHLSFPEHPSDGAIVYQGLRKDIKDVDVFLYYSPVYYTAFTYDKNGNVSSGAIVMVYANKGRVKDGIIDLPEIHTEATSSIDIKRVTPDMKMPELSDVIISQDNFEYSMLDPDISLHGETSFMISVPKYTVAGNLKSIIVTVLDPTDNRQSYSYLLRINRDRSAYEATIPPLYVQGSSQIKLEIYDYEAFAVAKYQTPVELTSIPEMVQNEVVFPDVIFEQPLQLASIILFPILLTLIILFWYRRRAEDNG